MNKLVSKNPVLRFKLGKKIVKGADGLKATKYGEQAYFLDNDGRVYTGNVNHLGSSNSKRLTQRYVVAGKLYGSFDGGKTYYNLATRNPLNSKSNLVLLNAINRRNSPKPDGETGNGSKGTKGKVTTIKPTTFPINTMYSGKMGGWNRNIGLGTIDDADSNRMLTEMGWQGLTAELVQLKLNENNIGGWGVTVDNKWGNQSRNALKGYYNRWLKLKESEIERPAELTLISPYQIMLLNQAVLQESPLPMPEYRTYNDYTAKDFSDKVRGLGITGNLLLINWMNTTGAQNYDWKGNNWARQFRSDVDKALNGDYSDTNIRNTFGTQGNWRKGFLGRGDFGDLQNALQTNAGVWNGIYDARLVNLVKNMDFSKLFKHKQGGLLISRNPVLRFKLNFR